ncbi:MAG: hypothetical protein IT168_33245 [Bryobacterales bacterium]|nr:hypothetical protein [Bryobacterales bacterium]
MTVTEDYKQMHVRLLPVVKEVVIAYSKERRISIDEALRRLIEAGLKAENRRRVRP